MIEMFNEDCMSLMKRYPDKYFELAIIDCPYGLKMDGASNNTRGTKTSLKRVSKKNPTGKGIPATKFESKNWDRAVPDVEYFKELQRVSKNQIIFGANHFIENIPDANSPCWIVWDKNNGGSDFADCELAYTSFKSAVRKFTFTWAGMLQGDMSNKQLRIHPTEKPIKLYEYLLTNYAKEGDKILDTHGGSFSSAIACHNLGFEYVGVELDKDYFDAAVLRFEEHKKQIRLF